jgi:hypothetical protein
LAKAGDLVAAKMILPAPRARTVDIGLAEIGRHDGAEALLQSYSAIVRAVAGGIVSPTEALELAELVDKRGQAITDAAPGRMKPKPTPEQAERQRLADEASQRLADRLAAAIG